MDNYIQSLLIVKREFTNDNLNSGNILLMSFTEWLEIELKERNWKHSELARQINFSEPAISLMFAGKRNPGVDMCKAIAKVFNKPVVVVLRAAGIADAEVNTDDIIEEVLQDLGGFGMSDKEDILEYVRMKRRIAEKNGTYSPND